MNLYTELAKEITDKYPRRRRQLIDQLEMLRREYKGSEDVAVEFALRRKLGLMNSEHNR
jgi:hypothetical protein